MTETFALVIEGLDHIDSLADIPREIVRSARIAVNDAATRGRTEIGRQVLRRVNLPASYVAPRNKRLHVSKKATNADLEAIIAARSRPTSLARYALDSNPGRGEGVRVKVARHGAVRTIGGRKSKNFSAFLIRLRAGSTLTDTKHNMGLAVRTSSGRPPPGYKPAPLGKNLWLLYGPSVSQIVYSEHNNGGVGTELSPEIQQMLEDEFWRQMEL